MTNNPSKALARLRELATYMDDLTGDPLPMHAWQSCADDLRAALSLLDEATRVLEPFAEGASHLHPATADDGVTLDGIEVRAWRAASAFLAKIRGVG